MYTWILHLSDSTQTQSTSWCFSLEGQFPSCLAVSSKPHRGVSQNIGRLFMNVLDIDSVDVLNVVGVPGTTRDRLWRAVGLPGLWSRCRMWLTMLLMLLAYVVCCCWWFVGMLLVYWWYVGGTKHVDHCLDYSVMSSINYHCCCRCRLVWVKFDQACWLLPAVKTLKGECV